MLAVLEAIALILLIPLKREVPYTLLVDRQTGFVEALKPLEHRSLTPDDALTRSFLVQYVIARESFDTATLQDNYRKVGLWSAGEARNDFSPDAVEQSAEPARHPAPRRNARRLRSTARWSASTPFAAIREAATRKSRTGRR